MTEYYTLKQFAKKLGFHQETIRLAAKQGKCGCMILGQWRFCDEDIDKLTGGKCSEKEAECITTTFRSVEKDLEALLAPVTS